MNYADAERIDTLMQKAQYTKQTSHKDADIIIVITCSVRDKAEQKVYSWVNQLPKEKTVILTGCMLRRDFKDSECQNSSKNQKKLQRICPNIDYFIPIKAINALVRTLENSIGRWRRE